MRGNDTEGVNKVGDEATDQNGSERESLLGSASGAADHVEPEGMADK